MGETSYDIELRTPPVGATPQEAIELVDPALCYDDWLTSSFCNTLYRVRTKDGATSILKVLHDRANLRNAAMEHRCSRDLTRADVPCIPRFQHSYWPQKGTEGSVALLRAYVDGELLNERRRPAAMFDTLRDMSVHALGAGYGLPTDLHDRQFIITHDGTPYLIDLEEAIACDGFSREMHERNLELLDHLQHWHKKMTPQPETRWHKVLHTIAHPLNG